jgi:hypothetical protein
MKKIIIISFIMLLIIILLSYLGAFYPSGKLRLSHKKLQLQTISYAMALYSEDNNGYYPYSEKGENVAIKLLSPYMGIASNMMKNISRGSDEKNSKDINLEAYTYVNSPGIKHSSNFKNKILIMEKKKGKKRYVLYEGGIVKAQRSSRRGSRRDRANKKKTEKTGDRLIIN